MPEEKPEDIVRVLRVIEYVGPRSKVEAQVAGSIHGTRYGWTGQSLRNVTHSVYTGVRITAVTVGAYPEILETAPVDPKWVADIAKQEHRNAVRLADLQRQQAQLDEARDAYIAEREAFIQQVVVDQEAINSEVEEGTQL